jgi:hypothetical protein
VTVEVEVARRAGEIVGARAPCRVHRVEVGRERGELLVGRPLDRTRAGGDVERLPDGVDLGQVAGGQRRHDRAAPGQLGHEPLAGELADRLADRLAVPKRSELGLDELRPGRSSPARSRPGFAGDDLQSCCVRTTSSLSGRSRHGDLDVVGDAAKDGVVGWCRLQNRPGDELGNRAVRDESGDETLPGDAAAQIPVEPEAPVPRTEDLTRTDRVRPGGTQDQSPPNEWARSA